MIGRLRAGPFVSTYAVESRDRAGHASMSKNPPPVSGKTTSLRTKAQTVTMYNPEQTKEKKERNMSIEQEKKVILEELEKELFNEDDSPPASKRRRRTSSDDEDSDDAE